MKDGESGIPVFFHSSYVLKHTETHSHLCKAESESSKQNEEDAVPRYLYLRQNCTQYEQCSE